MHAAGSSGDAWALQRLELAGSYEVETPDLPGHGGDRNPPLQRIEEMSAWIAQRHGALDSDAVVGHSMGAAVALALAAEHPVRGLVLVAPSRRPRVSADFVAAVRQDPSVAAERLASSGFAGAAPAALVRRASDFLARTDGAVLAADFGAVARFDASPLLPRVRGRALVVVGAEDRLTTVDEAEAVARDLPDARLVVIEGAGHMPMIERPREFNEALREFLGTL